MADKVYGLVLSAMRCEKFEHSDRIAVWSKSRERLERLLGEERVVAYVDEENEEDEPDGRRRWTKNFRRSGPLEWFNPTSVRTGEPVIVELSQPPRGINTAPEVM